MCHCTEAWAAACDGMRFCSGHCKTKLSKFAIFLHCWTFPCDSVLGYNVCCDACALSFCIIFCCCCSSSSSFAPFRALILSYVMLARRGQSWGLPILTAWQLESRATIVEEQAVSTVKQGPRKERTCEMRPLDVWTHWRRSLAAR